MTFLGAHGSYTSMCIIILTQELGMKKLCKGGYVPDLLSSDKKAMRMKVMRNVWTVLITIKLISSVHLLTIEGFNFYISEMKQ